MEMTCKDIMTAYPKSCLPDDPVIRAAEIMRNNDVGPVPVVKNRTGKQLAGMVTDRDIAIKVVATGRDPHTTRVEEVMSKGVVICRADDDCQHALEAMARHQIRRIPIVDADGALTGIISQADIARRISQQETGEVLENISKPRGLARTIGTAVRQRSPLHSEQTKGEQARTSNGDKLLVGAACLSLGAGIMYLLDPNRGRSRRATVQNRSAGLYRGIGRFAVKAQRDLQNRATGLVAEAKAKLRRENEVDDDILEARIRARLGHITAYSRAISIGVKKGCVTLHGPVPTDKIDDLVSAVGSVSGVREVISELHAPTPSETIQGFSAKAPGSRAEAAGSSTSPIIRLAAGAIGGTLAIYGLRKHGPLAKAAGTLGVGLLAGGISRKEMRPSPLGL
jgi:CBS domain-containing protein